MSSGEHRVSQEVRPIAICVFWRGGDILVAEGYDDVKGSAFYRPLGGTIEFGELGHQTAAREIKEETGRDVSNVRYLGTLENLFTYLGEQGHEIVMVYEAEFVDDSVYRADGVRCVEGDRTFMAVWKPFSGFAGGPARLVPEGLAEMLRAARTGARKSGHRA